MKEELKNLADNLRKHDFKAELREAFQDARKAPSSLWKKPKTPRPGKDIAIAGLAVAGVGLLLLLVTSGAFIGVVCLLLGLVAILAGLLGLKTEGRMLAIAGTGASLLAVLLAIGQIRSATRKPDPRDEIIRLLAAQLAQASDKSVSEKEAAALLARLEDAKSGKSEQGVADLADVVSKLQSITSTMDDKAVDAVSAGIGQLLAGGGASEAASSGIGKLLSNGGASEVVTGLGQLLSGGSPQKDKAEESFEATRDRVAADPSLTVRALNLPGLAPRSPDGKLLPASASGASAYDKATGKDGTSAEPPAGPTADRNKEVEKVLKRAKIETMTIALPNKVGLLLTKLPDGSFMGTFEVTQDQWLAIMGGENPSDEDNLGDDHPVDSIWPADALAFVEKLNALPDAKKAGLQFRIPSEEEWEKACLAGAKRKRDFGLRLDGVRVESGREGNVGEIAWRRDMFSSSAMRHGTSHSVGRKQPNAFGLYDMHGNVEELTFARNPTIASRFASKGGYWHDGDDSCQAYRTGKHVYEEPVRDPRTGGEMFNDSLGLRVAASILDADIRRIFGAAEKMAESGEAAFFGFYPGMSEEDAMHLAKHFGLSTDDELAKDSGNQNARNSGGVAMETPHCRFKVDPATKTVLQIRFDLPAILALTKKAYTKDKFGEFCEGMSKFIGKLECVQDGKSAHGYVDKAIVYQRKTSKGMIVSLEQEPERNDPAVLLTLETLDKDISSILAAAEKVAADGGAAFFGFYPGMSEADATKLAGHYGLKVGDNRGYAVDRTESIIDESAFQEEQKTGCCRFNVDSTTKSTIQIHLNLSAIQSLTKEKYSEYEREKYCDAISKFTGKLDCVNDGKGFGELFLYQRKTSDGSAVSFGDAVVKTRNSGGAITKSKEILLTLENTTAVASQAAARMAAANNARIEAVEPVLQKAGIKTKTIELPGGVLLLLTRLPDERYLGTFEVTQAQYASVMGANVSQCVGADLPVDSVTVQDCLDFIEKANELPAVKEEGLRFRLPSLAEWATACRAGTEGDYTRKLDGTDVTRNYSKIEGLSDMTRPAGQNAAVHGPHPVGTTTPNAFGLYDMFGNVSEWVSDKVQDNPHHIGSQYHLGWSWSGMNADPKIRVDGNRGHYEYADPVNPRSAATIGFRVSVVSMKGESADGNRELQRAKDEAAKAYALSNNGRIDAVKPVLEKAGIETREIELPGGVKLLLNKLPDGAWAAAFETTQAQWKSLLHDNPASFRGDPVCTDELILSIWRSWKDENPENYRGTGLPVDQITSGDIQAFLVLLNALPAVREAGLTFHLPTQDEWLYIARAGAKSKYAKPLGGGDSSVDFLGWHEGNVDGPKRLQIVGQKQPNAYGLYDVHGNAAELAEYYSDGTRSRQGLVKMGGSVGSGNYRHDKKDLALEKPRETFAEYSGERAEGAFSGFRVVATEGGLRHLVDPEMTAASNARIDAAKPALDAKGIETKVLDLTGGVKLLLNRLPGGLWAGAFEVTQAQFLSVLGENPSYVLDTSFAIDTQQRKAMERDWEYRTGDRPVDNVRKARADAFFRALNALPGAKEAGLTFRLPSCEEWVRFCGCRMNEYSLKEWAKGKLSGVDFKFNDSFYGKENETHVTETLQRFFDLEWDDRFESMDLPIGKELTDLGWFKNKENEYTSSSHPVGEKAPNIYGLYDIFGNVAEWTSTRSLEQDRMRKREGGVLPGDEMLPGGKIVVSQDYFVSGGSFQQRQSLGVQIAPAGLRGGISKGEPPGSAIGLRVWAEAAAPAKSAEPVAVSAAATPDASAESEAADPMDGASVYAFPSGVKVVMKIFADPAATQMAIVSADGKSIVKMVRLPNGEWAMPEKGANTAAKVAVQKSVTSPNPVAIAFIQDSNARVDAVKLVLKDAGIETKEVELPGGARILMNKLPNGAWMATFETTQAQFVSLFGKNPSRIKGGDRAVDNVSWNTATIYAALLNQLPSVKASGLHFRLPSSTEWEAACRAGGGITAAQGKPLEPGKGKLADMGWYDQNSDIEGVSQTHRVGLLQPNAFGLYDMIGNVSEWTATAYRHEGVASEQDKTSKRIWRGGSWISPKERCTATWRGLLPSDTTRPDTGFRLYATEDGSDAKVENVTFSSKDYNEATKPGPLPDDRSDREKLIGALIELQQEMEKAEMQLQLEEVRSYLDLLDVDPVYLLL